MPFYVKKAVLVLMSVLLLALPAASAPLSAASAAQNSSAHWIYFIRRSDNQLLRSHPDGSGKKTVSNVKVYDYAVAGNWIFYSDSRRTGFYKVHGDGTGNKRISKRIGGVLCVVDNSLIVASGGSSDATAHICRMDLDGKNFRRIGKDELYSDGFKLYEGNLYYASSDENLGIVKMRPDGSDRKKLTSPLVDPRNDNFALYGNSLYYIDPVKYSNSGIIRRVSLDGKKETFATISDAFMLGCVDGVLYYETLNGKVYKFNKDGTQKQAIPTSGWVVTRAFNSNAYMQFSE